VQALSEVACVLLLCCRDGCTHVLALCSRPYTTGPAWGKYLTRALHNAIKYWLLNPVSVLHKVSSLPGGWSLDVDALPRSICVSQHAARFQPRRRHTEA
jgi:hypothetical protein